MAVPLLLLLAQVTVTPPPPAAAMSDVIVVGRRAEKALAACLARQCPPAEEVEASLQASVEQFAEGRYVDARRTLTHAIGRNKRHAAQLPGPISSLYATLATVAEHEGLTSMWKNAARHNVEVLRANLGPAKPATLVEEIRLADDFVGLGITDAANGLYGKVRQRALDTGQPAIAATASYRRAWLAMLRNRNRDAERSADDAVMIAGPAQPAFAELRDILRMRIAVKKGNSGAVDALAALLRQSATRTPTLLFAPPVDDINPPVDLGHRGENADVRWADIGYWVRPDGRVGEVEMLRTSGLGQWRAGILKHVGARRYVPLDTPAIGPGVYRIDRFTVRAVFGVPTGTRIPTRYGPLSIHVVDLTETEALRATQQQRTAQRSPTAGPATRP